MNKAAIIALVVGAGIGFSAKAQSLLLNGSFESPVISGNTFQTTTPANWSWSGGTSGGIFNGNVPSNVGSWPSPEDGQQFVDIGDNSNDGPLSQDFTVTNQGIYILSWFDDTGQSGGLTTSPYSMTVINTGAVQTVTSNSFDAYNATSAWVARSIQLTLSPGTYTLQFQAQGVPGGLDTQIDNVSLVTSTASQTFLTYGLVAYYPFNGNASDASGHGHDGTVEGAVLTTNRFGNTNAAYYFDGTSDIDVPNSTNFDAYPAQGWTIALWAYPSTYLYPEHLIGKRQDGYPFWQLAIGAEAMNAIPIGQWIHVVMTFDATNAYYYTNGVFFQTDNNFGTAPIINPADVLIGGSAEYQKFVGNLDEVRIYNRELSAAEIQQLYDYSQNNPHSPTLTIIPSASNVILTWPTNAVGFYLESTTNLNTPAIWSTDSPLPVVINEWNTVTNPIAGTQMFYRLYQNTNPPATTPDGMALIPGGSFTMGNSIGDSDITDAPPTSVTLSAFYMDTNLVSYSQWQTVYNWAVTNGYIFDDVGYSKGTSFPVTAVNWYDTVKWCNARSQKAGLTPVYYTNDALTAVYTNGDVDAVYVNWTNSGYRLPTEAEWEKAARGGLSGQRFPWGDTISENQANYYGDPNGTQNSLDANFDFGPYGNNAIGSSSGYPDMTPVGYFAPNGYGLYDMAGNVFAWCWDWYGTTYAGGTDPRGPASGSSRVLRGGNWNYLAFYARCAYRIGYYAPNDPYYGDSSVRCVRAP